VDWWSKPSSIKREGTNPVCWKGFPQLMCSAWHFLYHLMAMSRLAAEEVDEPISTRSSCSDNSSENQSQLKSLQILKKFADFEEV
jgi:hypothetical protein